MPMASVPIGHGESVAIRATSRNLKAMNGNRDARHLLVPCVVHWGGDDAEGQVTTATSG